MADQLEKRFDADPDWALVRLAISEHVSRGIPRHEKMWAYFRNPLELVGLSGATGGKGWYRAAQEMGLPERIKGNGSGVYGDQRGRREVVIENDIGWRVQTMVDFMFGDPVRLESTSENESVKSAVDSVLEAVWENSGGIALLQDMAMLGHVFGHVDLLVRIDEEGLKGATLEDAAEWITIEPIDARRGVALVSADDYRELDGYAVHFERELNEVEGSRERKGRVGRLFGGRSGGDGSRVERKQGTVTEVFGKRAWRRFENGEEVARSACRLLGGEVPVVHIQNMRQPFVYSGIGEVEPLVALQDELNTRLSDRANRVTLQSFQMYLAKGIEGFSGAGVGPGVVWSTENPDASIERFGGDMQSPSEESHITEIREAMDKVSGVPPLAGGVVRAKLGNLSSGNALRVTLMGLIAKTRRKGVEMLVLRPDRVRFGGDEWEGVQRVSFDRFGTRTIEEWGDDGPQLVYADVARVRVKARVVQEFESTDLESPIPGEMEELRIEVSSGSDIARKIVKMDAVVQSVSYSVGGSRSERMITLVCVSSVGDEDPVSVSDAN